MPQLLAPLSVLFAALSLAAAGCLGSGREAPPPASEALTAAPAPPEPPRALPDADPKSLQESLLYEGDNQDVAKLAAATLLGALRDPGSGRALAHALSMERNGAVRVTAARALGSLGTPEAFEALRTALSDPDPAVRLAVVEGLGRVGTPEAIGLLVETAGRARGPEALAALDALGASRGLGSGAALGTVDAGDPARFVVQPVVPADPALSRTLYVDASEGDDESGSGAEAAPFRTLSRAVRELRRGMGDRVLATGGAHELPFREELSIPVHASGLPGSPTVLGAWPGRPLPVLDGARDGAPGEPGMETGVHVAASWFRVEDFTVRHYQASGIHLNGVTGSAIVRCTAERCDRHGLFAYYSPESSIIEPRVRGCFNQGISVRSSPRTVVVGGRSDGNGIDGLLLLQGSEGVVVSGFEARGNRRGIAFIERSGGGRVIGVSLHGNREGDLVREGGLQVEVLGSEIGQTR
jgi:hypothetical protein